MLHGTNAWVHGPALTALGHIGPEAKETIPLIVEFLAKPKNRIMAIQALGGMGPAAGETVERLIPFLESDIANERLITCVALLKIGPNAWRSTNVLATLARDDQDSRVREWAGKALESIRK